MVHDCDYERAGRVRIAAKSRVRFSSGKNDLLTQVAALFRGQRDLKGLVGVDRLRRALVAASKGITIIETISAARIAATLVGSSLSLAHTDSHR